MKCAITLVLFLTAVHAVARETALKWPSSPTAKEYQVEVGRDENFRDLVFQKTLKDASATVDLPDGRYFYHYRYVDDRGHYSAWSAVKPVDVFPAVVPAETVERQRVTYYRQLPKIETRWRVQGESPLFKLTVEKDRNFVHQEEISEMKAAFTPDGPGDYVFKVAPLISAGTGPSTLVKHVTVAQGQISPPKWDMPPRVKIEEGEEVTLKWKEVPEAASYHIFISRLPLASGQKTIPVVEAGGVPKNSYVVSLEPGVYFLHVASEVENFKTPYSVQSLAVILNNPYRFNSYQFFGRYAYSEINYDNLVYETGSYVQNQYSPGGSFLGRGNLWFRDSRLGLQFSALWGGFNYGGNLISFSDAQAEMAMRYDVVTNGVRSEIRPYFGVRAWTMPIVRPPGLNSSLLRIFNPILAGPVLGAVLVEPIGSRWDFEMEGQMSAPVTNSTLGNDSIGDIHADPVANVRGDLSLNYKFTPTVKGSLGIEYNEDVFQWPYRNTESRVDMSSISAFAGVQTVAEAEDTPYDTQSDFKLELKYDYTPIFYHAYLEEMKSASLPNPLVEFGVDYGGTGSLEAVRWLTRSAQGFRLTTAWSSFNLGSTSYSYNEFSGQWGLRILRKSNFRLENFLGARIWTMPTIAIVPSTGLNRSLSPSLVGPMDLLSLNLKIARWFGVGLTGQISSPFLVMDKDSSVDTIHWEAMSYRSQFLLNFRFNHFLTAGLGAGYQYDQFRYNIAGGTDANSSTVTMASPSYSIFGSYIF